MYCGNCGAELQEGSIFCTSCGTKVSNQETEIADCDQTCTEQSATPTPKKKTLITTIIIVAIAIIVGIGIWLIISTTAKANLKEQLLRDWTRVESESGTYYTLGLDFYNDKFKYTFESLYFDEVIATFSYEIISGNEIRIDNRSTTYTIEFNDDKTMMIVTPAITSVDSKEYWYNFD